MKLTSVLRSVFTQMFAAAVLFCSTTSAHADVIQFKTGDSASYTISTEWIHETSEAILSGWLGFQKHKTIYNTSLECDLTILSCNEQTQSYPFLVEVTIKNPKLIRISDGKKEANDLFPEGVFDLPLQFLVVGDYEVIEVADTINGLMPSWLNSYGHYISLSDIAELERLLNTTILITDINNALGELFQLSGIDLVESASYPASFKEIFGLNEDWLVDQENKYTINSLTQGVVKASRTGEGTVGKGELNGTMSLTGSVLWHQFSPLIQQRNTLTTIRYANAHETTITENTIKLTITPK